jgi:hypothetical protein
MKRLIGSIEIATRADVPVWMFVMLGKTLRLFLGSHERVSRLWAASSTSLLASECLGALYRMMVTHVVTHAAELAEAQAPLVAKGGSYKDVVAARQVEHLSPAHQIWRWHRMYFPLVHWIYTQYVVCFYTILHAEQVGAADHDLIRHTTSEHQLPTARFAYMHRTARTCKCSRMRRRRTWPVQTPTVIQMAIVASRSAQRCQSLQMTCDGPRRRPTFSSPTLWRVSRSAYRTQGLLSTTSL